jgi:shikimate kinase
MLLKNELISYIMVVGEIMAKRNSIFLIGQMGSGKTTIGEYLANRLQLKFFDADQVLIARTGMSIADIFAKETEQGFRQHEEKIIAELTALSAIVLATGGGAVLSAANRIALKTHGVVIYLRTSVSVLAARAQADQNRPLLHGPDINTVFTQLQQQREAFYTETADFIFNTDHHSIDYIASNIIRVL